MHELPQNEWVVIFYPNTGSARLCPTLEFAQHTLSLNSRKYIYRNANEFRQRHDHHSLEKYWELLYDHVRWKFPRTATGSIDDWYREPPDTDTENFCNLFWQFLQDVGDRLQAPTVKTEKTKEHYEFKLASMAQLYSDEESYKKKYNRQARVVFSALVENGRQFMAEDEIRQLILRLVAERKLKTKQEPWVVFQYYRPQFIKDGYVVRGRTSRARAR